MDEGGERTYSGIFNETQKERFRPYIRFIAWLIIFCFVYQDIASAYGPDFANSLSAQFKSSKPRIQHPVTQQPLNISWLTPIKSFFIQDAYADDDDHKSTPPPQQPPPTTVSNTVSTPRVSSSSLPPLF